MDVHSRVNFQIFPTNPTNLVWVLLRRPEELFDVIALGDHLYTSATRDSMHWKEVVVDVTWTSGFFQPSTEDSTIGSQMNLSLLLLFKRNCLLIFVALIIFKQFRL